MIDRIIAKLKASPYPPYSPNTASKAFLVADYQLLQLGIDYLAVHKDAASVAGVTLPALRW